jgi:hypothetical protein
LPAVRLALEAIAVCAIAVAITVLVGGGIHFACPADAWRLQEVYAGRTAR